MLQRIIDFSITNKLIIGLLVTGLVLIGIYQTTKLPIDAVPDITDNQVQVITLAPSFGAPDIERLVTFPIEQVNNNIPGMKEIRSFSRFGLSLVTIVFDDKTDIYWARQQVSERLQQIQNQIPSGIGQPELGPVSSGLGEIYQYTVRPRKGFEKKYDATALRTIQDWIVRRQLLGVKGVAEVSSFGGKLKQYEVAIEPNKLNALGLTINDVFDALEKNNQNTGGAYIEKGPTVLYIRSDGLIKNIEDIKSIAIENKNLTTPVFIKDIAEVKIGFATRYGAMCYNDKGEVSGAIVMMLKGANSSEVIKNVKDRIAQIQKTLPEGIIIDPFLDRSKMVNNAIGTVEKNLLEGALIVIFILVIFLGNLRAGLIVASVIPLALLFAICMMNLFGVSGNLMSLGALDFGLIVDGAVIIVEAVMHQMTKNKLYTNAEFYTTDEMNNTVKNAASKMMNSAVFGQLIILIVYLPIFSLEGIEGKMFKPMAQTVAFALLGAFILSVTYIPMMSSLFLSKKIKVQENLSDKIMKKIENKYQHTLAFLLHYPKTILITIISIFILSLYILTKLGGEFIPALEEGDFAVDTRVLTGSNLNTTIEFTQKAAHLLKSNFPEVEKIVTKIGSGEVPTDPMPMEASDMMVILKPKNEWTSAHNFPDLAKKMGAKLQDIPGITAGFQFPVQMRFNELMTGARQDVVCKIFGENLDTLTNVAEKLGKIINQVKGTQNLYIEPISGMPQVIIEYNRAMIAQYQLNIEDINKVINSSFAGKVSGLVFEDEKRFNLVVKLNSDARSNLYDIQHLLIPTPNGIQIPLSQLAKVEIKDGPNQIQREDAKRRIVVGFNILNRDVQSIVKELKTKVENKINFPTGYYVTYGGAFENLEKAKSRLMIAVPISLFLIFILLFFAFNSVKQGIIIYSAIPLSAIGGILFLALRNMPFSISAGIGFIALFGVAVLNGIVLIAEINRLKKLNKYSLSRIVILGCKVRLRPVLMTAFVASLGFLPMALSNGAGAEVQRPLATVVIGGLLVATFLTLFILPILYIIMEKPKRKITKTLHIVIILISLNSISCFAQDNITLNDALFAAKENNLSIKTEKQKTAYLIALSKVGQEYYNTEIVSELGQFNSIFMDTKIGILQKIKFPTVYKKQKNVLNEQAKIGNWNEAILQKEINSKIQQLFFEILLLNKKKELLEKSNQLFIEFHRKALLRYSKGETNLLEKISAESQQEQVNIQLENLKIDIENAILNFNFLIGSTENKIPISDNLIMNYDIENELNNANEHPSVKIIEQQKNIHQAEIEFEKTKLLPEITGGIYEQSMRINSNSFFRPMLFYTQLGISIPLFNKSTKNKIRAMYELKTIDDMEINLQKKKIENEFKEKNNNLLKLKKSLEYYNNKGLKNSEKIISIAEKQYLNGEINYLQWAMLINQSIEIENNYLNTIKNINDISIE
ncbi:MAG: CusA/CzcA family heavy metal efflux RND transporter, partial [Chitinophagaceae bacterium]|nr:CusA/CzcA family heavy metal efflux RND transporter [Chitinophagaceae bacterium]